MQPRTSGFVTVALVCAVALTLAAITSCDNPASQNALIRPAGEPGVGQQQFDTDDQAAAAADADGALKTSYFPISTRSAWPPSPPISIWTQRTSAPSRPAC